MNKGDTVVYAQDLSIMGPPWNPILIEMTVERDYGGTAAVSDGNRPHLVNTDLLFPDMERAVKAVAMRTLTIADTAESDAKQARKVANEWAKKLEALD